MLNRESVLNASDAQLESVDAPELGGKAFVPVMSLDELDELAKFQKSAKANGGNENAAMAVQIIRDDKGARVFQDADAPALAKKRGAGRAILRILKKFNQVNGLADDAAEQIAGN